jgi:hypothetical protein
VRGTETATDTTTPSAEPTSASAAAVATAPAEPSSSPAPSVVPTAAAPAAASESAEVQPAARAASRDASSAPDARPPRRREPGQLALQLYASALMMTNVAPAIRPGAALGLGLGVARARLRWMGELDARAALPHRETTDQGSARFVLVAAGVRMCTEGLMVRGQLGVSGCASAEIGTLAARGSDTDEPGSSRSLWAALGPGLRLAWYGARRVGVRLGSELLFPLAQPSYTLGEVTVFSVRPVTFRVDLSLCVKLL